MATYLRKILAIVIFVLGSFSQVHSQNYPIPGGLVLPGQQTCFPVSVFGIGQLQPYSMGMWGYFLNNIGVEIQTSHPWTLEITLVSPTGTVLVLSSFNGAGGVNYTGTNFTYSPASSIIGAPAPFTGNFLPQEPVGLSKFDWEIADGTWNLCILDTLTDTTSYNGPPGLGAISTASGTIGFGFSAPPPPPCWGLLGDNYIDICPGETVDLTSYYPSGFGWNYTFYTNNWTLIPNPTAVPGPGNYYIEGMDPGGCVDDATVTINVMQVNLGPDVNIDICQGITIDLDTYFTSNGTQTYSLNGNAASNLVTLPGNYQCISQSGNCSDTATAFVSVFPQPAIGVDLTINSCVTSVIDLTTLYNTSGLTASWEYLGVPVANPAAISQPGFYTLFASNSAGCTDTANVTIVNGSGPALGADQSASICSGASVDLSLLFNTTGFTTSWTLNGTVVPNPTLVSVAGTYMLIASDPGGCADTALVTVNTMLSPNLGSNQTVDFCTGTSVNFTTLYNTSGFSTFWELSGNAVAAPSTVSAPGTYLLVAADPITGCSDSAQVILNAINPPALGPDQPVSICSGATADLTTYYNTSGFTINWYFGGVAFTNPSAAAVAGNYSLIATNPGGCSDTAVITLNLVISPVLGNNQSINFCSGTSIDLTSLYNTTGLVSAWTLNGVPVSNPAVVTTGGIYTIEATNANGCSAQAFVTITNLPSPVLGVNQNVAFCPGAFVDLTALYNTTGLTSAWTTGGNTVANPSMISVAGNYNLIALAVNGCSDSVQVVVTAYSAPSPGPDQQVAICNGNLLDLTSLYSVPGSTTAWSFNSVTVPDPTAVSGSGIYTLTCTNASGCTAAANVTVSINAGPSLGSDQTLNVCNGTTTDITSFFTLTGLTVAWNLNGNVIPDPVAVSASGNFQLIATDVNNCVDTATVSVIVISLPVPGANQSFDVCPWTMINLTTIYPLNGWSLSCTLNGSPIMNLTAVHDSGDYVLMVTDTNGCSGTATVHISEVECECAGDFDFTGKCLQDPFTFTVLADSAINAAHWTFTNTSLSDNYGIQPVIHFPVAGNISVTLELQLTCGTKLIKKIINVEDCAELCHFYIPSAFTPNNDGKNDRFKSYSECEPLEYGLEIWNRYGQLIYKSDNINYTWDGKDDPEGMYVYYVNYRMPYQDKKAVTGKVAIVR